MATFKRASLGPVKTAPGSTRRCVACPAARHRTPETRADNQERSLSPALLAAIVALSGGLASAPLIDPPKAYADDDVADENLSPYQKRQRELERRRELLRQAREQAEQKSGPTNEGSADDAANKATEAVEAGNAGRRATTDKLKDELRTKSVQQYEEQAKKSFRAPPPENPLENSPLNFSLPPLPADLSDIKMPSFSAPALKGDSSEDTAPAVSVPKFEAPKFPKFEAPAPPPPAPAPAPRVAPALPQVVPKADLKLQEAAKKAEQPKKVEEPKKQEKPGKRKGPLPLLLAQILMLGAYAGIFAAMTKYSKQSSEVLQAATKKVIELYKQAEKAMPQ